MQPSCMLFCAFSSSDKAMDWVEKFSDHLARRSFYRSVLLVRIDNFLEQSADLKDPSLRARWFDFCSFVVADPQKLALPDFPRDFSGLRRAWPAKFLPGFLAMLYRSLSDQQAAYASDHQPEEPMDMVLCYEADGPLAALSSGAEGMKVFAVNPEQVSFWEPMRHFMEQYHAWRHAVPWLAEEGLQSC